jgi:hypothetical protein
MKSYLKGENEMRAKSLIVLVIALALFQGCEKPTLVVPQTEDLSGYWDVHHIRYDGALVRTTNVFISQSGDSVWFLEEADTISTGVIVADTIRCTDMYYLGISRIFIDDNSHMHSEPPLAEYYKRLDFVRHGCEKALA